MRLISTLGSKELTGLTLWPPFYRLLRPLPRPPTHKPDSSEVLRDGNRYQVYKPIDNTKKENAPSIFSHQSIPSAGDTKDAVVIDEPPRNMSVDWNTGSKSINVTDWRADRGLSKAAEPFLFFCFFYDGRPIGFPAVEKRRWTGLPNQKKPLLPNFVGVLFFPYQSFIWWPFSFSRYTIELADTVLKRCAQRTKKRLRVAKWMRKGRGPPGKNKQKQTNERNQIERNRWSSGEWSCVAVGVFPRKCCGLVWAFEPHYELL